MIVGRAAEGLVITRREKNRKLVYERYKGLEKSIENHPGYVFEGRFLKPGWEPSLDKLAARYNHLRLALALDEALEDFGVEGYMDKYKPGVTRWLSRDYSVDGDRVRFVREGEV